MEGTFLDFVHCAVSRVTLKQHAVYSTRSTDIFGVPVIGSACRKQLFENSRFYRAMLAQSAVMRLLLSVCNDQVP